MAKTNIVTGAKSTPRLTVSLLLRSLAVLIITGIVILSATVLATGFCTEEVGYSIMHRPAGSDTPTEVYTHYYIDGDDTRFEDFNGKEDYYKVLLRGNINDPKNPSLDEGQLTTIVWIAQGCALLAFVGLIYSCMWAAGDADANKKELGGAPFDRLRGLKIGLLANIPFATSYLILVITRAFNVWGGFVTFYKLFNGFACGINHTFLAKVGNNMPLSAVGALGLIIGLLILPVTAAIAYTIGSKHIVIKNKIMYK